MFAKDSRSKRMRNGKSSSRVVRQRTAPVLELLEGRVLLSMTRIAAISDYGWTESGESPWLFPATKFPIGHDRRGRQGRSGGMKQLEHGQHEDFFLAHRCRRGRIEKGCGLSRLGYINGRYAS